MWYTWRWIIEQIFRTMKNKGLKIEDSQIEDPELNYKIYRYYVLRQQSK